MKTNASRLLEQMGIAHELVEYDVDPEDLSAETVARKIGLPPGQVFKTLAVRAGSSVYFAVVPGDRELDLKALASASGERRLELVPLKDVQALTGYIRGGVTAIAARKPCPVYLDAAAFDFPCISISAGIRGTQILLAPADYERATNAVTGIFSKPKP